MGLALLIVVLKTLAIKTGQAKYDVASRFWARIFAANFLLGVVTGIGIPLAEEGIFSSFPESAFLRAFLFGEKRLSRFGLGRCIWEFSGCTPDLDFVGSPDLQLHSEGAGSCFS
jgi:cytochrome bd-type quinol oxidase subunit 1